MLSWLFFLFAASLAKECSFWVSMNDCIALTSCFWISTDGVCSDIRDWTRTMNTASTCDASVDMWGCYNHVDCFWVAEKGNCETVVNWQYHVGAPQDPSTQPCNFWNTEGDCWAFEKCFWNKRQNSCQQLSTVGSSTTDSPTAAPTRDVQAMNMCEVMTEHSACALNDDCIWSDKDLKCLALDGDCMSLNSETLCAHNDQCMWEDSKAVCQSACEQISTESKCAYNAECFWMEDVCSPINAACNRLETPSFCSHNEHCFWSEIQDECLSFYGPCDTMTTDEFCSTGDHCVWNEVTALCISAPEETTEAAIVDCEAITDVNTCQKSNSTEHMVPCEWSEAQDKCVEFKFDCEDYMTRDSCNAASYGHMKCHWDGECDELKVLKLESDTGSKLESGTGSKLGSDLESNPENSSFINQFYLEIFGGFGLFLGVVASFLVQRYWEKSREAPEEYFDITLRSV